MGMYTELHLNVKLKRETPQDVINILKYMVHDKKALLDISDILPKHELFIKETRWNFMLVCDSYCFPADTHSTIRFDDIGDRYYLCVRCNFKNYEDEISKFIDWITPYVEPDYTSFSGFYRYEENDNPTLIYIPKRD